ncbi:MAG: hypothetical protein ACYSUS_01375 [Planctomycetota bacterium]|jgi:hypothetical protein
MEAINLTEDEVTVLHDVVKNYLTELHTELSYTDDRDFKAALKNRQETLQVVLLKLASVVEQLVDPPWIPCNARSELHIISLRF